MNFALPSAFPLWASTLGWFVASLACVGVAAVGMPTPGWAAKAPESTVIAIVAPAPAPNAEAPVAGGRCRTCGIVEAVRQVQAVGAVPAAYELTVRFRDGSRRLSNHSDDAGWQVGDSIMLLGGARLADRI